MVTFLPPEELQKPISIPRMRNISVLEIEKEVVSRDTVWWTTFAIPASSLFGFADDEVWGNVHSVDVGNIFWDQMREVECKKVELGIIFDKKKAS